MAKKSIPILINIRKKLATRRLFFAYGFWKTTAENFQAFPALMMTNAQKILIKDFHNLFSTNATSSPPLHISVTLSSQINIFLRSYTKSYSPTNM